MFDDEFHSSGFRSGSRQPHHPAQRAVIQSGEVGVDRAGARLVAAADRERRRLERDLHDGPQQRLVSLSVRLRLLASHLAPGSEAERLLADARNELAASLRELRDLARGIHPAILSDRGLPAALEALTARAPLPVELRVEPGGRAPEAVEVAAYYLVSEALTNTLKHSYATSAGVSVARRSGQLVVEVTDDGAGGADPVTGSGLRGLADRIETLGGRLEVSSPPGAGTTLRAEIPLERGRPQPKGSIKSSVRSAAGNDGLADGVQRALGCEPRDISDYARDAAATGVWNPSASRAA